MKTNLAREQEYEAEELPCSHRRHFCAPDLKGGSGSFRLFTGGDELYDAMISAIEGAQESIRLEVFIFAADEVGWRFAKALSAKVRAGVDVRFHFDSRGAATGYSPEIFREMVDAGVVLKWYHPWSWRHPSRYFQRNHRKLLVIDDQELFLGGFNIRRENSLAIFGPTRKRDTHVSLRGELARYAAILFDRLWNHPQRPGDEVEDIAGDIADFDPLQVPNLSGLVWKRIACFYTRIIARAHRHVYITTPYFCPGSIVERAVRRAAKRGVDVRLLVPQDSDPPFVGWLTRSGYTRMMSEGVRIYEYTAPRKLHAKTAVIDDDWCVIGSPNLDRLSLFVNHELVLMARDRGLGSALRDQYFRDLADAEEVQPSIWAERGWSERCLEAMSWTARKLL